MKLSELWEWYGTVDRGTYAFWGFLLFAIKHNLDRFVAAAFFQHPLFLYSYLISSPSGTLLTIQPRDLPLYATLVVLALPFIWIGTVLTIRRLRSIGLSPWLVFLFFVPALNLLFFLLLCLIPPSADVAVVAKPGRLRLLDRLIPDDKFGSAALALALNVVSALLFTLFSVDVMRNYGWGLFVGMPFCLGFTSVLIYSYHRPRSLGSCLIVSLCSVGLVGAALTAFAFEGIICVLMAAPLAVVLAMLGAWIAYLLQSRPASKQGIAPMFFTLIFAVPLITGMESTDPRPSQFEVKTAIEIDAAPEEVWKHVIAFSELPEPKEWIFRIGIAYPVRARIDGAGIGAVRHCEFSTGEFTEPIEVWKTNELLKFSVTSNPQPMQEWTPYSRIRPPHLDGFLVSNGGQFKLTRLPGNRTYLEGTTWYRHHMWPETYWKLWADFIIHKIHMRVLNHVAFQSRTGK